MACLLCLPGLPAFSASTVKSNEVSLSYSGPAVDFEYTLPSEILLKRFFQEVGTSDSIVFDRFFGPASRLGWVRRQDVLGYESIERFNSEGANMFVRIGMDSLRTAVAETLPVDLWQDQGLSWIGNAIVGTIGNPEEEHFHVTSIAYSDVWSSWESGNQNAGFQFGFRPWRTNPYLYVLAHAGHWNGQPLLTFEGRAGYTLFGSTKLEARVSMPLAQGAKLSAGVSVDPTRIGSHEIDTTHIAVTFERVIRVHGKVPDTVFFCGFRTAVNENHSTPRSENLFVAGLSKNW